MEDFNTLYYDKYGYGYDFPFITYRTYFSDDTFVNTIIGDYALWFKFIKQKYCYKPTDDCTNLEHIRSYYCFMRLTNMIDRDRIYWEKIGGYEIIADKLKCKKKLAVDKIIQMARTYSDIYALKPLKGLCISITFMKTDAHEQIYDFLYSK